MGQLVKEWSKKLLLPNPSIRIHLIGVAGSGMNGLAYLLLEVGHKVSGSDKVSSKETRRLESLGLTFITPHQTYILSDVDLVIYSSAIKKDNIVLQEAKRLNIPTLRRAEALSCLMLGKRGVIVSGTHGKTTSSSLISHILKSSSYPVSYYIGAEIPVLRKNSHWNENGDIFVAEGDESDGSLINFFPHYSIVLNIEEEHLDHYKDINDICDTFSKLCEQTKNKIFYYKDDKYASEICSNRNNSISYGWNSNSDYWATNLVSKKNATEFAVYNKDGKIMDLRLGIPGKHNVLNALASISLVLELGIEKSKIADAMTSFRGAKRRFEVKRSNDFVTIVDDYAHHPSEIKASVNTALTSTALNGEKNKKIICIFQPHRNSRTQAMLKEFGTCFDGVDELWVTGIYSAGEKAIQGITGESVVESVNKLGNVPSVKYHEDIRTLHLAIGNKLGFGDFIITMGAGNIHTVGTKIAQNLDMLDKIKEAMSDESAVVKMYESMRKHTTMKVGGPAQFWIEPTKVSSVSNLIKYSSEVGIPFRVIGRGSNVLVRDGGISGIVVNLSRGEFIEMSNEGNNLIKVGAGVKYKSLSEFAFKSKISGFEWMEGIPGNVGGSLRMNAGAMGKESFDNLVSVKLIDQEGNILEKNASEIYFEYRNVPEFAYNIVISAIFRGEESTEDEISNIMQTFKQKRKTSQPIAASVGCIFKNPKDIPAGRLISDLGFKDLYFGNCSVSKKHGNFIVNNGSASAEEVINLINNIQEKALRQMNIRLETEVQIVGQKDTI